MDTEHDTGGRQNPHGNSGQGKEAGATGGSTATHKKVSHMPGEVPGDSSLSSDIPGHLEAARRDILSWLVTDSTDEDKCYDMLREMKVVNEEGYFCYDQDPVGFNMDAIAAAEQDTMMDSPDPVVNDEIADDQAHKRSKIWGPVHGTRQCERLQKYEGKSILQMAQEVKKRKDMTPAASKLKGITDPNPFSLLQLPHLKFIANPVGLLVDESTCFGSADESVDTAQAEDTVHVTVSSSVEQADSTP